MKNNFLTKNQSKIFVAFKKCCFGEEKEENGFPYIQGNCERVKLQMLIYRMLPELIFEVEKKSGAILIDSLHLFAILNENYNPEVSIKMNLYQNENGSYFLEMI